MAIVLRGQKGSPLTVQELDGNFQDLSTRLTKLEEDPFHAEGIAEIKLEDGHLKVTGTKGSQLADIVLPLPKFNARGEWKEGQVYRPYDVVCQGMKMWMCTRAHQSREMTRDQENWSLLMKGDQALCSGASSSTTSIETKPVSMRDALPLYEMATLPKKAEMGSIGLLCFGKDRPAEVVFYDAICWRFMGSGQQV